MATKARNPKGKKTEKKEKKTVRKLSEMSELDWLRVEEQSAKRSKPVRKEDAEKMVAAALPRAESGKVEIVALANFDEATLLEENQRSVEFLVEELEKAATICKARDNIPKAKELLRRLIAANEQKGIFIDTLAVKDLREQIAVADAVNVRAEVDGDAMELFNFRKSYGEIQDAVDEARELMKRMKTGSAENIGADVDKLADRYYRFVGQLLKDRRIREVPGAKLSEWARNRHSFSDEAFAARNHAGEKMWFWGVIGDEKSMASARAMRILFSKLDWLVRKTSETNGKSDPASATTPAPTDAPTTTASASE